MPVISINEQVADLGGVLKPAMVEKLLCKSEHDICSG